MANLLRPMKLLATLSFVLLLAGCVGPNIAKQAHDQAAYDSASEHVSPVEFKQQYASVGMAQSAQRVAYLGMSNLSQRAYIKVSSKSVLGGGWSDHVIYVDLAELDATFRDSLPTTQLQSLEH